LRIRLTAAFLLAVVLATLHASTGSATDLATVDEYVAQSYDDSDVPGMVVVVTRGASVEMVGSYGIDGRGEPMGDSTLLRVASLTKTVTSVAVHQLAEQGKIGLDDPVVTHLPEFDLDDDRVEEITVQQLLDNRSGMAEAQFDLAELNESGSLKEYLRRMGSARLASDPGTDRAYCNPNWEVLARMVEVVSGQRFDDYLKANVFGPLGMESSTVDARTVDPPGGYQEIFGFNVARADSLLFSASSGSNGLITTGRDLALWTRWVATGEGGEILSAAGRDAILHRALKGEGADGFDPMSSAGGRVAKNGLQMTESSQLMAAPETGTGVAVVVNSSTLSSPTYAIAAGVLDILGGKRPDAAGGGTTGVAVLLGAIALAGVTLGVLGVRRSPRWAERRAGKSSWISTLRVAWLLIPAALFAALPSLGPLLTNGVRTVTWGQLSYLILTPMIVLAVLALAGVCVAVARVVALTTVGRSASSREALSR